MCASGLTMAAEIDPIEGKDTSYVHVKLFRKEKQLSLKELASKSGLSISFLSNYENGKVNISVASLKKISQALGVSVSQLVMDDDVRDVQLVRASERYVLAHHKTHSGMAYMDYLIRGPSNEMSVTVTRLPPHSDTGEFAMHKGEEFVYVLKGVATVVINENSYLLSEGDIIYYSSQKLHKVANDQDGNLEYLLTNNPPTF